MCDSLSNCGIIDSARPPIHGENGIVKLDRLTVVMKSNEK